MNSELLLLEVESIIKKGMDDCQPAEQIIEELRTLLADDAVLSDAKTLREFINTYRMTPAMCFAEKEYWRGRTHMEYRLRREQYADAIARIIKPEAMTVTHPDEAAIRADERERCARVAERTSLNSYDAGECRADIAAAIRAGGAK